MNPLSASANVVEVNALSHTYLEGTRRHKVLDAVSFALRAGESVALRGRSGSGKSTLLNLIAGIDTADSGAVRIAGRTITAMNERERTVFRRQHIGFVYQSFNLLPTVNVADNVRLVLELNGQRAEPAGQRVSELLAAVGLADRADSYPDLLSGGEQQRIAVARALASRPLLLLADEPTGNLDDASAGQVLTLLDTLRREQGGCLILATHSAAVAARCDRVLELRNGQLVADSP
jgi:putative ABC transport system ATP-binding protein